jgi:PAS domain S-box-containing protein
MKLTVRFLLSWVLVLVLAGAAWGRPVYTVGIRAISPPFSFLAVKGGEQGVRGYSVDEMVMLGKLMGADIEFRALHDLGERRDIFKKGSVDILAHDSLAVARELGGEWIPVGISLRHHLYVNKDCRSVTCLRDLSNRRVVAISSAPYSPEIVLNGEVLWLTSPLEALNMLSQGVVDVFVAPSERVADDLIDRFQIPSIVKKGVVLGETPIGIIVSDRNPNLAAELRDAFRHLQDTGMAAQLRDKWFGKPTITDDIRHYAKYVAIGSGVLGIVFIVIVVWNVLLKRRVEKVTLDLFRTEQRYRDLIESSPDMIFLVTEAGDILHANERARTFLRFPEEKGMANLRDIVTRDNTDEISAFLNKVFNDGCDKHELEMIADSAQPMEVEVAGRIVRGTERSQLLACLFARNVTERNRMEEELIQSERLGIIGTMAASLAHEITKGLLEAATPRPLTLHSIEMSALIADSLSLLGSKGKRERLSVQLPEKPLYIRGDERALQQVLVNLVFNSLAVTGEDGAIVISACGDAEEDATVRIEVRDDGTGIEPHNLTQIFEPFFSSRKGGFGLGLFITRRMVERLDGIIFAESEHGRGTSMYLEFPAANPKES